MRMESRNVGAIGDRKTPREREKGEGKRDREVRILPVRIEEKQ